MASASLPTSTRRPIEPTVAAAAVIVLVLWPVEISTAFGLPAHPLVLHVPVVFVPLLGLAVIAAAIVPRWQQRFGLALAIFSVVTLAATLLTVGAGEAFLERRPGGMGDDPTMKDHEAAGETVRLAMVLLTFTLAGLLFVKRGVGNTVLRVLAVLLALTAVFFVIRTGHLGAKMAWGREGQGGPPTGFQFELGTPPAGDG